MIRTIKLKLNVSSDAKISLFKTMRDYTTAFNICSTWGFDNHTANKIDCHKSTYYKIRELIPNFPSSLVQCARDVACASLKSVKCRYKPIRKEHSAMLYNSQVIRVCLESGYATIATSNGRVKVEFIVPKYYIPYLTWKIKSSTLSLRKTGNMFYLHCQIETNTPKIIPDQMVLGIDRGIINIAVCSDNTFFNSRAVKNTRSQYAYLRAQLQSKGTRSAKRKLKKLSGRERRFVTDVNHCISKQIIQTQYTVFALEDLTKIRVQKRRGKIFNRKLNNWSFFELEQFIRYKAENLGKRVIFIDARYTSQKCSICGHVYKGNRNGSSFKCCKCGFELHADLNASRNIAQDGISVLSRLPVNQPNVACL
ncbi:MAG: transposase [Candidatus Paceibacterota bacterium]